MKQLIGVILCCIGVVFLIGWWLLSTFHIQQNKLYSESSLIFADALQREKRLRVDRMFINYDPQSSPDEIPGTEKIEWCDQDYLFYSDSTRSFLDSLFRAALLERKIQAKTAIHCVWDGRVVDTSLDSAFYTEALSLTQFTYRRDENPDRNISLQAYIQIPCGTVWKHSSLMWMILGLGLLLLCSIIGGSYLWYRKMQRIAKQKSELQQQKQQQEQEQQILLQQQQELQEKEKQLPAMVTQNKTFKWLKLSEDLFFDDEHGELCYKNEVSLCLTENSLKLFRGFIKVRQQKLTYEKICKDILVRSIKDGLSKSDRDAAANAIRHLRIHLKPIPVIQIVPIRGIGYGMIIQDAQQEDTAGGEE